ncbi:acetyltransferase [Roseburia hominis]
MDKIVILGYGGHGKSVADSIIRQGKYEIAGYTDNEDKQQDNITYLGSDNKLEEIFASGVANAVLGIGFLGKSLIRDRIYEKAKNIGFLFPAIIDSTASVAIDAIINEGAFVGKRAVVNANATVGKMCIINTGAIIEHDNRIGSFSHIAVGATICGEVTIGDHCLVGANSTVIQGIQIGNNATVGAGSVVLNNINDFEKVVGVPAKLVRS